GAALIHPRVAGGQADDRRHPSLLRRVCAADVNGVWILSIAHGGDVSDDDPRHDDHQEYLPPKRSDVLSSFDGRLAFVLRIAPLHAPQGIPADASPPR